MCQWKLEQVTKTFTDTDDDDNVYDDSLANK